MHAATLGDTIKHVTIKELVPVRTLSKSREVLQRLRSAIWSGDLAPGTPLREAHIAKQLNVSQVPVREALLQLENLGLVVRVPDRGTTVTELSRTNILQMMEVRRHLEELAFRLAASNISKEVEEELRAHLRTMEKLVVKKDHFGVAEEDLEFHRTVWRASGNDVLAQTLERLCVAVYAFVSLKRHAAGETMKSAVKSHKKLLDALLSRDAKRITAGIDEHLNPQDVIPPSITK
ncbi:MAG: transcriptional regulator, GntR family [Edaphobacter sp.]|nr:transcriptional regulator, GntR family [Edaphobacter sp.]